MKHVSSEKRHNKAIESCSSSHSSSVSVTRIVDSTWLESLFMETRTRLESRWEKWWLDSSHVFHKMTRLESQSMTRDSS